MPHSERAHRNAETSRSPNMGTVEQFLRGTKGEASKTSPTCSPSPTSPSSSPFFQRLKHQDSEEEQGQFHKKSVLTKVKEKAKKLRHSLSKKRQEGEDDDDENSTPSRGVNLEDDEEEEEEEDAEYLGAPMYESEMAPEGYKENIRQHPRASPVISMKHVLPTPVKSEGTTQPAIAAAATTTTSPGPNMTMTSGSRSAHALSSKIQGLANSEHGAESHQASSSTSSAPAHKTSLSLRAVPQTAPPAKMSMLSKTSSRISPRNSSAPETPQTSSLSFSSPRTSETNTSGGPTEHIWNKGVSVKQYLMSKLEPGDDEKTMSPVTSEAMSPGSRRTPGDAGVIEKVRGAVNSLLGSQESSVKSPTTRASSQIQVPTNNTQQVDQEENQGRILQAN